MKTELKKSKKKVLIVIGYICLLIPIFYSMYNAVPASDDFIYGTLASSRNIIINACEYVKYTFWNVSCRWLVYFLQKCLNPLNLYSIFGIHLGHIYGISVSIVFLIAFFIIKYSISFFFSQIISDDNKEIVVFLTMALLLSTYYYSEVYNWYIGGTAYAIPFSLTLLLFVNIIKYFKNGYNKKEYFLLFLVGLIPSTNEFLCVPIGMIYLLYFIPSIKDTKNNIIKIKNIIPLLFYIVLGSTVVFAPGTFARREKSNITAPIWRLVIQAIINIVVRLKDIVIYHPLAVVLFVIIFFMGIKSKGKEKHCIIKYVSVFGMGIIGGILPYCLGKGFTSTYMDVRMYYILDYMLIISMALIIFMVAQNIGIDYAIEIDMQSNVRCSAIIIMFAYLMLVPQNLYLKIPQIEIIKKASFLKDNYELWNGILTEIENSTEADVYITRKSKLEWTPYFLYVGLEPQNVYDQPMDTIFPSDEIMINVYYKKDSIVLNYQD